MSLVKFVRRSVSRQRRWADWHKEHFEFLRDFLAPMIGYQAAGPVANDTLVATFENSYWFVTRRQTRRYLTAAARVQAHLEHDRQKKFVPFDEPDEFGYTMDDKGEIGISFIEIAEFDSEIVEIAGRITRRLPPEEQIMASYIAEGCTIAQCAERMAKTFKQARNIHDDTIMDLRDGILAAGFAMKAEWAPRLMKNWVRRVLQGHGLLPRPQSERPLAEGVGGTGDAGHGGAAP